jgi:hypothetical protein
MQVMTREKYFGTFLAAATVILFGLTVLPQVAAQQKDFSKFTMGGSIGLSNPLGKSSDLFDVGYLATIGAGYNFSKKLGVIAEYGYNRMGIDQKAADALAGISSTTGSAVAATGKVWAITGNAIMRANRPGKVNFYGIGGAGIYQRRVLLSVTKTTGTSTQTTSATLISSAFGINFGGGFTFDAFKGFKGYVEARYHHAFTKDTDVQLLPISIGFRW